MAISKKEALSVVLLCKSICKAPASSAKQLELHHLVGDATGIMPVYSAKGKIC